MAARDIEKFRQSGRIAAAVREYGRTLIVPGARIEEIALACERRLREMGGEPAFPAQLSRNHIAAHYCSPPGDPTTVQPGDLVKLDVGVHVDGYVADNAVTVEAGGSPDSAIVAASRAALENAIAHMGPGVPIATVGAAIHDTITAFGFKPVLNLTGHGVGHYTVHCGPAIPNYADSRAGRLKPGQVIACEPFASDGKGHVEHLGRAEVFQLRRKAKSKDSLPRRWEEALAATRGLPFARRDLLRFLEAGEAEECLEGLQRRNLLHEYPPLAEKPGVRISQHEHTICIHEHGAEVLTRID